MFYLLAYLLGFHKRSILYLALVGEEVIMDTKNANAVEPQWYQEWSVDKVG